MLPLSFSPNLFCLSLHEHVIQKGTACLETPRMVIFY